MPVDRRNSLVEPSVALRRIRLDSRGRRAQFERHPFEPNSKFFAEHHRPLSLNIPNMGQRHQVYLIARIRPHGSTVPRYRCIAGYHHQWCFDLSPIRAARRCITAIKQKEHTDILREELRAVDGKYGTFGHKPELPDRPCPFASFLLCLNWDVDFTPTPPALPIFSGDVHENSIVRANADCWEISMWLFVSTCVNSGIHVTRHIVNDDGLTIIDITDPASPACCFLQWGEILPLDARGYLAHYGWTAQDERRSDEIGLKYASAIQALDDVPLVPSHALAETWPKSFAYHQQVTNRKLANDEVNDEDYGAEAQVESRNVPDGAKPSVDSGLDEGQTLAPGTFPSLADMALRKAVSQGLKTGDTLPIEDIFWLPGRADMIRQLLYEQGWIQDSAVPLMKRLAEQDLERTPGALDLADVQMSNHQLVCVTQDLQSLTTLNLSRNHVVTTAAVEKILAMLPSLRRMLLLGCPSVSTEDLGALLDAKPHLFYKLETLIHPLLTAPAKEAIWHPIITFVAPVGGIYYSGYEGVSLPFFSPAAVVQGMDDLFTALNRTSISNRDTLDYDLSSALTVAFTGCSRASAGCSWYERSIAAAPVLVPPTRSRGTEIGSSCFLSRTTSRKWMQLHAGGHSYIYSQLPSSQSQRLPRLVRNTSRQHVRRLRTKATAAAAMCQPPHASLRLTVWTNPSWTSKYMVSARSWSWRYKRAVPLCQKTPYGTPKKL